MRENRREGAVLALVIVALALVGVAMFVLTEGANTMLFQADAAYLDAVERDLVASGLAWARQRLAADRDVAVGAPLELDTASFAAANVKLVVTILDVQADRADVRIEAVASKGRRTFDIRQEHTIRLPGPA